MLRFAIWCLFLSLAAQQAAAQQTAAISPAHLALAMDLLDASNAKANILRMESLSEPPILQLVRKANPDVDAATLEAFRTAFHEEMQASMGGLMRQLAQVYARHFTDGEIHAVIQFYRSPAGRKLLAETPAVMQESVALGHAWGREAGLLAAQRAAARMKSKGIKI